MDKMFAFKKRLNVVGALSSQSFEVLNAGPTVGLSVHLANKSLSFHTKLFIFKKSTVQVNGPNQEKCQNGYYSIRPVL